MRTALLGFAFAMSVIAPTASAGNFLQKATQKALPFLPSTSKIMDLGIDMATPKKQVEMIKNPNELMSKGGSALVVTTLPSRVTNPDAFKAQPAPSRYPETPAVMSTMPGTLYGTSTSPTGYTMARPSNFGPLKCTMDMVTCPDGSAVPRSGPNCSGICPASPISVANARKSFKPTPQFAIPSTRKGNPRAPNRAMAL